MIDATEMPVEDVLALMDSVQPNTGIIYHRGRKKTALDAYIYEDGDLRKVQEHASKLFDEGTHTLCSRLDTESELFEYIIIKVNG